MANRERIQSPLRALHSEAVLDGALQREGNRMRISVHLIRVPDGQKLWASQFDEEFSGIFAIEDTIRAG